MDLTTTILALLTLGLIGLVFYLISKLKSQPGQNTNDTMMLLQQQIQEMNKTVDQKLSESFRVTRDTQDNLNKTLCGNNLAN